MVDRFRALGYLILFTCFLEGEGYNVTTLRYRRQASSDGDCLLPKHPRHGEWTVIKPAGRYSPGDWVKLGAILQFSCKPTFKLFPEEKMGFGLYRNCKDGNWGGHPPVCIRTCSRSIVTNERMIVECIYNGGKTDCNNPYDGTIASIRCRDLYHDASLTYNPQRICTGDSWDYNPPTCDPACGHKSVKPTELLIGSGKAVRAEYPWQVAIYLNKVHICGGSIISTNVILTAAHCFDSEKWDEYEVGAGKLYRAYESPNDTDAQYRDVLDVKMLPEFNEGGFLGFDIALVILKKHLQISQSVGLICLDRGNFIDSSLADAEGVITGWGYTKEHGDPSETLRKMQVKYYTTKECTKMLPPDFKIYYTPYVPDKICAGVLRSNGSACQSDSGGPLAFRSQEDGRFYIRGVVSVGPNKSIAACDASLYTSVAFHKDYIIEILAKYRNLGLKEPSLSTTTSAPIRKLGGDSCFLPKHPINGKWFFVYKTNIIDEQEVSENTLIKFECNVGYKLYPEYNATYPNNECKKTKWGILPKCRKTCQSRISTDRLKITCEFNGNNVSCVNPYVGTEATVQCATFYHDPALEDVTKRTPKCLDEGWQYQLPICKPECGVTSVQPQSLVIGGNKTQRGDYPWQVAIFIENVQKCGGSIISEKVVLSAAHCFEDLKNLDLYKVGAGKLHRAYNDPRDTYAQYSKVQKIEIRNFDDQFRGDIAVIILETPFNLTTYVRPVCFNEEEFNEELLMNTTGIVTGWGYTSETGHASEVLKELTVNYFGRDDCRAHIHYDLRQYYTFDKICAGVLTKDENVCRGDSGGPLIFRLESLYYIRGIVSIGARKLNAECDVTSFAFYTSVNFHRRFIAKFVKQYEINIP